MRLPMFQDNKPIFEFRGPWGVPVQVGASLFLLMLLFVDFGGAPRDFAFDMMFFAILIGSIYLHELGHAWGCLIQGVPVRRVMIYGGGGFCEPTRSGSRSEQELIVAMGPIVNLFLWAVAGVIAPMIADPDVNNIDVSKKISKQLGGVGACPAARTEGQQLENRARAHPTSKPPPKSDRRTSLS